MGYGWVGFVRSIGALILFVRGFGEIIRPAQCSSELCLNWKSLPSHRYYLAVSMADLSKIMAKHGDPGATPPGPSMSSSGLLPSRFRAGTVCALAGPERLELGGAVVFGHNVSWRYRWTDAADGSLEKWEPSSSCSSSTTTTIMSSFSAFSPTRLSSVPMMRLAPWSAPIVSRSDSATASGTSRDEDSSAGATSSTGITSPQSRGASSLSLSASDFASASGSGQHSEYADDDQRAGARRREKRRRLEQVILESYSTASYSTVAHASNISSAPSHGRRLREETRETERKEGL